MADLREKGIECVKRAQAEEAKQNWREALRHYESAIECLIQSMKYEKTESVRKTLQTRITQYLEHAEKLKVFVASDQPQEATAISSGGGPASKDKSGDSEQALRAQILEAAVLSKPNVRWADVAGLESVKDALKEAVVYPLRMGHLFDSRLEAWSGILLFGPPGTGKTMLAKAVATEAQTNLFLQVSVSRIMSKYVGESERLVSMLFKVARESAPSIIFCDEVDALCGQRSDSDHEVSRKVKNVFLEEMDGCGANNSGILILAATNMPWMLDDAFMRRFQKKVYIPLPSVESRAEIVRVLLGNVPHGLSSADCMTIAVATENFTGSDMQTLVKTARNRGLGTLKFATHFVLVPYPERYLVENPRPASPSPAAGASSGQLIGFPSTLSKARLTKAQLSALQLAAAGDGAAGTLADMSMMLEPCSPGHPNAVELTFKEVAEREWFHRVHLPDVNMADFRYALDKVKPSPLHRPLSEYEDFTSKFGERGDG